MNAVRAPAIDAVSILIWVQSGRRARRGRAMLQHSRSDDDYDTAPRDLGAR